jgi:hypothetical protein
MVLRQGGCVLGSVTASSVDPSAESTAVGELHGTRESEIVVQRPSSAAHGRVRLGDTTLLVLPPGIGTHLATLPAFQDDYGDAAVVYEEYDPDDADEAEPLLTLWVTVRAAPEVEALYETLVAELESVHAGLAQDVLGRTLHRRGLGHGVLLTPDEALRRLSRILGVLEPALARIAAQPSVALERRVERARWRPRDIVPAGWVGDLVRDSGTVIEEGRVVALARARVLRTHVTTDLPEHRQLREGVIRLARRARLLARHCARAAQSYEGERRRWGRAREDGTSVFETRFLPRIRVLESWEREAYSLEVGFAQLLRRHDFLASVGPARTRLEPTPLFLNRPGYREAYVALQETLDLGEAAPLGDEIRVRYRQLSTLYEYWCFVKIVELLRERDDLGAPEPRSAFSVIDEVYRPELEPGQSFRFPWTRGGSVVVSYEPEFPPVGRRAEARFHATLGTGTLRPDVTIELDRPGAPSAILVLDAKSHRVFREDAFQHVADYRTRICDLATGHQPIRQVFLLHRDALRAPVMNLPGYLDGRVGGATSSVLGAACLLPDRTTATRRVIERFLTLNEANRELRLLPAAAPDG